MAGGVPPLVGPPTLGPPTAGPAGVADATPPMGGGGLGGGDLGPTPDADSPSGVLGLGGAPPSPETPLLANEDVLMGALLSRGMRSESFHLEASNEDALIERIMRDFFDGVSSTSEYKRSRVALWENWEGITYQKTFPYENAANIQVPFTSVQVQQWVARLLKALVGSDLIAKFESLDESIEQGSLSEANAWFQWEMDEVVELRAVLEDLFQLVLIEGTGIVKPYYDKVRRQMISSEEYPMPDRPGVLSNYLEMVLEKIFESKTIMDVKQSAPGIFSLKVKDPDEIRPDSAKVSFSIRNDRLCAKIERIETIFNGVKIPRINTENLVLINSKPEVDALPFIADRMWLTLNEFKQGLDNNTWRTFAPDDVELIVGTATSKTPDIVPMDYTTMQDEEEGTESTSPTTGDWQNRFIEVYYWEGWWPLKDIYAQLEWPAQALLPAVQLAVWMHPRTRQILKIHRLEDLNKDGSRSYIKFGFMDKHDRFFSISLAEWLRHVQAELNGIHNLRLDAGSLTVMPFGFYKPLAGFNQDKIQLEPGVLIPTADPASVNFPKLNAAPQWAYQDEALIKNYGGEQAGLGSSAGLGSFVSKRTTASEFQGTANAIDLRTEDVVLRQLRSLRKLLYRVLGLYQQFAPETRVFQVGGEDGARLVRKFKMDRLNGKIMLRLTGSLDQINPQLQRDISVNMLQLLLNQLLIQVGIVQPDTIFAAIEQVAKANHYKNVPLHKPDIPETSPAPNIEHHRMLLGEPVEPHMNENFNEHLKSHVALVSDPQLERKLPSVQSRQILAMHIQKTMQLQKLAQFIRQQEAIQATAMAQQMQAMGIRPGLEGGQQTGDSAEPGTPAEGVKQPAAQAA